MRGEKRNDKLHHIGRPKVEINKNLADRLRELRGKMSRQQFIDEVGLTQIKKPDEAMTVEQYRQFENKTRNVPEQVIKKICKYFNITEYELLGIPEPDVDSINHSAELFAELVADFEIWNLINYLKRMGYDVINIAEDISVIELKRELNTYILSYSQLQKLAVETRENIEQVLNDNSSK